VFSKRGKFKISAKKRTRKLQSLRRNLAEGAPESGYKLLGCSGMTARGQDTEMKRGEGRRRGKVTVLRFKERERKDLEGIVVLPSQIVCSNQKRKKKQELRQSPLSQGGQGKSK